jgi:hypothetical protein
VDNNANRKEHQHKLRAAAKEGDSQSGKSIQRPKDKPEVLICKAYQMRHSFGKKGYKCSECTN